MILAAVTILLALSATEVKWELVEDNRDSCLTVQVVN